MVESSPATPEDEASGALALLPAARLGFLLRARRKEAHVGVRTAARVVGIETGALRDIESGRKPPEVGVLAALLKCYRVPLGEFVPPRSQLVVTSPDATSHEILRSYVDAVRKWRKAGRKEKLRFRRDDVITLGKVLGTDPDEIERRLIAITGCSRAEARRLRKLFLAALIATPLAYGAAGAVPAAAAVAHSQTVPAVSDPSAMPSAAQAPQTISSASTTLRFTLLPGSLTLETGAPELSPQADGSIKATVPFTVIDARGSGTGWTLDASFSSQDSDAQPIADQLSNLNDVSAVAPELSPLPADLTDTPEPIVEATPGTIGMGRFAGSLTTAITPESHGKAAGSVILTLAPSPSDGQFAAN